MAIVDGTGKIGQQVAQRHRSTRYLRAYTKPTTARTAKEIASSNQHKAVVALWKALSQANIKKWNQAAGNILFVRAFQNKSNPSGYNLFMKLNRTLSVIGQPTISVPPVVPVIKPIKSFSAVSSAGGHTLILNFSPTVPTGTTYLVFASANQSAARSYCSNAYRNIGYLAAGTTTGSNQYAAFNTYFGIGPVSGSKIFLYMVPVDNASGFRGLPIFTSVVVNP